MKHLTLAKLLIILLSLQVLSLVVFVALLFWYRWDAPNCQIFLNADPALFAWVVFTGLKVVNLVAILVYLLRIYRREVAVKSRINIVIVILVLINLCLLLPNGWFGRLIGCYGP